MADISYVPNWVNGTFAAPSHSTLPVINPATEQPLASISATSPSEIDAILSDSWTAFHSGAWSRADPTTRFTVLSQAATLLRARLPEFIDLETAQTGRPIREMRAQLARIPEWLEYFASLARTHEGSVMPFKGPVLNHVSRLPLGVVALVTPWNHPLLIAVKKLAPALAAGNCVVLKPSELAPLSVVRLGQLFKDAGLPDGTLQIVNGRGAETGKALCWSPRVAKIDLTGGLDTYRAVAEVAGRNMVPVTAELGGKAGVCVFPSVAVEDAVRAALFAGFIASGQTCVTGSRVIVHEEIYDSFVERLVERTKSLRIGDPTQTETQVGAVINAAAVERCKGFVERAIAQGGKVLCGGKATTLNGKGFFVEPTLIAVAADSDLAQQEVFGPVIAVLKAKDEEDVVRLANSTDFALGMSIWTNDFKQGHRVADRIEAGLVWVNAHHLNDPSSPWGGFKTSGLGKENGREAYESYTKTKSTILNYGPVPDWFDEGVGATRYG